MSDQQIAMKQYESTAVIANAIEIATDVIMQVAGNTIGNMIDGEVITPSLLRPTVGAKVQQGLARFMTSSSLTGDV